MIKGFMDMSKKKHNDYGTGVPKHEIEALAQTLYPDIIAFFEREEIQKEFEEWENTQGDDGTKKE